MFGMVLFQTSAALKTIASFNKMSASQSATDSMVDFHGFLMGSKIIRISIVWYGDWTKDTEGTKSLMTDFISNVAKSDYWKIVGFYGAGGAIQMAQSIDVPAPRGSSTITRSGAMNITSSAVRKGLLPDDEDTIYVFIPSKEIVETDGFCADYVRLFDPSPCLTVTLSDLSLPVLSRST